VVVAAGRAGWTTVSADVDPAVWPGLAELSGGRHLVADAAALPLAALTADALATEPPYHESATASVVAAVAEAARVLRPGARLAMLVATAQAPAVRVAAGTSGLAIDLDVAIDRKGTDVTCLRMVRAA
jgi:tRNA G10  N-methylase Trm11